MSTILKRYVIFMSILGEQKDQLAERKKRAEVRIQKMNE